MIIVGQDYELTLDTGINISAMSIKRILYKKPSGSVVHYLTASIVSNTKLKSLVSHGINSVAGEWFFQSYVVAADGKIYKGIPARLIVEQGIETL